MNRKIDMNLIKQTIEKQLKEIEDMKARGEISEEDKEYIEIAKPTYIENWNEEVFRYSIPTTIIPISLEEVRLLLDISDARVKFNKEYIPEELKNLYGKVEEALGLYPEGVFVRLGSRSPKDSYTMEKNNRCLKNTYDVFASLFESIRVFEDLCLFDRINYSPVLVLRKWIPIDKWKEFRCFIENGELVGVSQYFYKENFKEISENKEDILSSIYALFNKVKDLLPSNIVFDVIYDNNQTILLEINPYSNRYTDPCLFSWNEIEFKQFEFRCLG